MRTTLPPGELPPLNWTAHNDELLCCLFALVAVLALWFVFTVVGTSAPSRDQQCAAARVVQRTRTEHDASWI